MALYLIMSCAVGGDHGSLEEITCRQTTLSTILFYWTANNYYTQLNSHSSKNRDWPRQKECPTTPRVYVHLVFICPPRPPTIRRGTCLFVFKQKNYLKLFTFAREIRDRKKCWWYYVKSRKYMCFGCRVHLLNTCRPRTYYQVNDGFLHKLTLNR